MVYIYHIEKFVSIYDMMNWKLVFGVQLILLTGYSALKVKTQNYAMKKQKIIVSNETVIDIAIVFSEIACAQQCLGTPTCCSASYEIVTRECLLHSCCNLEMQPSENSIFIQKTGKLSSYILYFVLYLSEGQHTVLS